MTRSLIAILVSAAFVPACARRADAPEGPAEDEQWITPSSREGAGVSEERVRVFDLPQAVAASGRVVFHDEHVVHVYSPVTGRITRVLAQPGDRVRRGSALVAILSPDVGSAFSDLVKAQADLQQADLELRRQERLARVEAASQRELEAAQDADGKARAEYHRAEQRATLLRGGAVDSVTQEYTLRSFIEGEVISRQANPGVEVQGQYSGGQAVELFTVGDIRKVWVIADVAEADLRRVARGAELTLRVAAYPDREFKGRVDWIAPTLDPALRTAHVRAELSNEGGALKPEMYGQVSIAATPLRVLAVPREAITHIGSTAFAYVDRGEAPDARRRMKRTMVHVVDHGGPLLEVKAGLVDGDRVAVERGPAQRPAEGGRVALSPVQAQMAALEVMAAQAQDVPDAVELGGRLTFDDLRVSHVFSPVAGRVTRVLAGPGQAVRRGEPLAAILSPDVGSALADLVKAQADAAQAGHELERQRELNEAHAGARRDLELAEATFRKAQAELERAREKSRLLGEGSVDQVTQEYLVRSPIDGQVVARSVNPGMEVQGQYAGASNPVELFTIGDARRLVVLADAYEVDLPRLRVGDDVSVRVGAYQDRPFQGRIEWISDVIDPQLRTVRVRCAIDNRAGLLKPEMYEPVRIEVPGRNLLAVPRDALLRVGDETVVFVELAAEDGKRVFERRRVTADEARAGGLVPVAGAVRPGDLVVTRGAIFVLGML